MPIVHLYSHRMPCQQVFLAFLFKEKVHFFPKIYFTLNYINSWIKKEKTEDKNHSISLVTVNALKIPLAETYVIKDIIYL